MPYICAHSDHPDSYPWSSFATAGEGRHRDYNNDDCDCGGVWISDEEYQRRVQEAWNRVLGFPKGYSGSHYQGFRF